MRFWCDKGAWVSKKTQERFKSVSPADIKSIAIIRHAALGDMVLTRAFIVEARKFFPNASITLSIVSNYSSGVPDDLVDRVHVAIGSDQREVTKREQIKVARALGEHDIIFDMAVSSRSLLLCMLNKARLKISFPYRQWQRIFYDACVFRSDMQFEAETLLDMLRLFGAKPTFPPNFKMPASVFNDKQNINKPYIVYFTTASTDNKCWPAEYFAKLIQQSSTQHDNYDHIILEGLAKWESVEPLVQLISKDAEVKNFKVQRTTSVSETLTFLSGAKVVICNDTGIRHLAICCEVPTVGIFYSTTTIFPYRYWPRYGAHDAVFQADGSIPSVESVLGSINKVLKS